MCSSELESQNPVPARTTGVIGEAAAFDGSAVLTLPDSPSLAIPAGGSFTFSAWLRPDQATGEQLIYARHDAGNTPLVGVSQGHPSVAVT